jgi:two-component system response regulator HydG
MSESTNRPIRVLIVDDDEGHAEALADGLELDEHECTVVNSGDAGIAKLEEQSFDAVLTDLIMHGKSGLEVLQESRRLQPTAVVLVITGHGSVETAVEAMHKGAADYLTKPVNLHELRAKLPRAVEAVRDRALNIELRRQLDKRFGFEKIIGHSPPMQRLFELLGRVSGTSATVLVLGESGTGKELVAQAIHRNSPRKDGPFVPVNCAALAEGLIESELFGHVKGAFTGAHAANEGRILYASGGTLFLDEVGDMPLETQAKLLRVLENREVVPVGGQQEIPVDVRLVAATNRDLREMVAAGTFREDLFFRLQVVSLHLPPLRERTGDIPILIDHLIGEMSAAHDREVTGIAPEARMLLVRYPWPGNVRELRNCIENMVVLARGPLLEKQDVPINVVEEGSNQPERSGGYNLAGRSLAEVERDLIAENLELMGGNREKTSKVLGIGERTLYRKIKEYGLS